MPDEPLLITGANVIDGVHHDNVIGDVLVDHGRISRVGRGLVPPPGARILGATGLDLLPGFIDVHAHDDAALFADRGIEPKLRQGVTTTVVGNCGHGCAPTIAGSALEDYSTPVLGAFPARTWATFEDYLDQLGRDEFEIKACALVPHTPIRASVLGMERRPADRQQVAAIADRFTAALQAGAVGASLGLMYSPANSADTEELLAIAGAVAAADALLVCHLRNEADHLFASLEEFAALGRATGAALHVSHLKVTGPKNFGLMPAVIERLDQLRADGIDITADIYPYTAGSTTAATLMPQWAMDQGLPGLLAELGRPAFRQEITDALGLPWTDGLENYYHSLGPERIALAGFRQPPNESFDGCSLADIALRRDQEPAEALMDLLLEESGHLTVVLFQTDPDGIDTALAWPHTLIGSDGLPHRSGYVHPRLYGAFSRILTEYCGPGRPLTRTEAVRRMTSGAAARFGLTTGRIEPGRAADLQLINPRSYRDRATYTTPRQSPSGIEAVLINGRVIT